MSRRGTDGTLMAGQRVERVEVEWPWKPEARRMGGRWVQRSPGPGTAREQIL